MHSSTCALMWAFVWLVTVSLIVELPSAVCQSSGDSLETRDQHTQLVIDGGSEQSPTVTTVFSEPDPLSVAAAGVTGKVLLLDLANSEQKGCNEAMDHDDNRSRRSGGGPGPLAEDQEAKGENEDDDDEGDVEEGEEVEEEEEGDEEEDEEEEDEHNVEKRDLNERIRQHMLEQRAVNYTGCDTCRKMHLDMKQASLNHIKKYVLSFLGFNDSGPPKKPGAWPSIPEYIWEQYYANQQGSGPFSSPGDDWEEERVNHQSQQRYLDMHASSSSSSSSAQGATTDQDYMADDPNWNLRQQSSSSQPSQDEEPFTQLVKTNRIYLFPNVTKFRHQQHDLMSFEFPAAMSKRKKNHDGKSGGDSLNPLMYLDVSKALLHVSFCNEHINSALLDELRGHLSRESPFRVTVHRLVAKDHQSGGGIGASEKFSKEEVTVDIPTRLLEDLLSAKEKPDHQQSYQNSSSNSMGGRPRCRRRIQLDITQMVKDWYKYPKKNHGLLLTTEPVRLKNAISLKQTDHKPFLELVTETTRKKRVKREMSMTCKEGDYERRCCMYPLKVDFELFGWDFIIAPKQYEANYCAGECTINFLPSYTHTHMMQLSTSAPACCSPKKMQPLSLLYFNRKEQVIYTKMENMIVETCGCS